jgi:hypothetical protein
VLPVADPMFSMQQGQVQIRVLEREKIALRDHQVVGYKVETRLNDFVSYSWVDRQGSTLRRQLIGQLTMERTSEAEAKKISAVLSEPLTLPVMDLDRFKKVQPQTVNQLTGGAQSPLGALGGLLKAD